MKRLDNIFSSVKGTIFSFTLYMKVLSDNILSTLVTSATYLPSALKCLLCSLLTKLLFQGRKVGGGGLE